MPIPDAWHLCVAFGPLGIYFLLLGLLNLSRRPFITTGARDAAALGVAVAGFVVIGPMELFMPLSALDRFGGYVWLLLLTFYALCLSLTVLTMRPRLVIYNTDLDSLRPILSHVSATLDPEVRWAGDSLVMPRMGVRLNIEAHPAARNVQLVSAGVRQDYLGWRQLEYGLAESLRESPAGKSFYGAALALLGVVMLGCIAWWMAASPAEVAQGLDQMLHP